MSLPDLLAEALKYQGLRENIGGKSNPVILDWYKELGMGGIKDSISIAWCGTFIAICAKRSGRKWIQPKDNFMLARNWAKFAGSTKLARPAVGAVVVFWRGSPKGWQGHVGIIVGKDARGNLMVIGGNQSNMCKISPYTTERVIGYYWLHKADGGGLVPHAHRFNLPIVDSDGKFETNEA